MGQTVANNSSLNSWKEIAVYMSRGVRTVQRWERELSLPVHRIRHSAKSPVFAFKAELDNWMRAQGGVPDTTSVIVGNGKVSTFAAVRDRAGAVKRSTRLCAEAMHLIDEQQSRTRLLIDQIQRMANFLPRLAAVRRGPPSDKLTSQKRVS